MPDNDYMLTLNHQLIYMKYSMTKAYMKEEKKKQKQYTHAYMSD